MLKKFPKSPAKVIFILILTMLGLQAFTGQQGILMWRQYSLQSDNLSREKAQLALKRQSLESEIKLLKSGHVNSDYVEELAQEKLSYISPQDKVIILGNKPRTQTQ